MMSWSTIQTLILLFGPLILPKLITIFRSARHGRPSTRPLNRPTQFSLNIIFVVIIAFLASSLPYFHDENIITSVGSRLMLTPNDVLAKRLESLRLQQGLPGVTASDLRLLDMLRTREGRLFFAAYGPGPLINCAWCTLSDPSSFLYYYIPTMAIPHAANVAVLGFVTSSLFSSEGKFLRIHATISGIGMALGEFMLLYNFDISQNARATTTNDVNWYHWKLLTYRSLAIAMVDFIFGIMIYVRSTGRYGFGFITDTEKIEAIRKSMDTTLGNVRTNLFVKSTATRSEATLMKVFDFWRIESNNRKSVADQLESTRNEVLERIDVGSINEEAFKFTTNLMEAVLNPKSVSHVHTSGGSLSE